MALLKKVLFVGATTIICFLLCQYPISVESHETDMTKELILTKQEKLAFDKFKSQVMANVTKNPVAHPFMKTDLYLLRWLRAKNLNVYQAVHDMKDCLEWRRENRIQNIQKEDWSDMISEHPYIMDVIDLQGRPVALGSLGAGWNLRRLHLAGKGPRLQRYVYKIIEEIFDRTYEINKKHSNVTQFSVVISLQGFNIVNQACPMCIATHLQVLTTYNRFYPNFAHAIIGINVPTTFSVILEAARPMLDKQTRESLKLYGYNQQQWKPALDREISEEQLPEEFGGTRLIPDDDFDR